MLMSPALQVKFYKKAAHGERQETGTYFGLASGERGGRGWAFCGWGGGGVAWFGFMSLGFGSSGGVIASVLAGGRTGG